MFPPDLDCITAVLLKEYFEPGIRMTVSGGGMSVREVALQKVLLFAGVVVAFVGCFFGEKMYFVSGTK